MVAHKFYIFGPEHPVIRNWINREWLQYSTSPGFDYCLPDMALKIELRIEYRAKGFILRFYSNFGPI